MGLFFRSRRRSRGGGLFSLIVIGGILYATGVLPAAWDYIKNAGNACYSLTNSVGIGGQSICGAVTSFMDMVDRNLTGLGGGVGNWFSDIEQKFNEQWANSKTRIELVNLTDQVDTAKESLLRSGLVSSQPTLDSLIQTGPSSLPVGGGEIGLLKGSLDSFAISQQLSSTQPALSLEWLQKGASVGAFGLPSQLSLGNAYANSGQNGAAAAYYHQALQSLNALRSNNSPASQQLLGSLGASPQELQAQIIAAIKQIQPAAR